jgi:hypothetical protein
LIKLKHPANIEGRLLPKGAVISTLPVEVEERFIKAGTAERCVNGKGKVEKTKAKAEAVKPVDTVEQKQAEATTPAAEQTGSQAEPAQPAEQSTAPAAQTAEQPAQFGRSSKPKAD